MSETKRVFPYSSGDRIRMTNWAEDKFVTIIAYGDVMFLGKLNTGEEESYYKDAKMAYNSTWEAYSPNPGESEAFVEYVPEHTNFKGRPVAEHQYLLLEQPAPETFNRVRQGGSIWKCRVIPTERIYP